MNRPGIVLAASGYHFAIERLQSAERKQTDEPGSANEANLVRAGCEALFWLFVLHEDFKSLVEVKTGQNIFIWWASQVDAGKYMNGLRLIRNRVTHSYRYYWKLWDVNDLKWTDIDPPSAQELARSGGQYVSQQHIDYQSFIVGEEISKPLVAISRSMENMYMKFDLSYW